jgi:hypothetical protein
LTSRRLCLDCTQQIQYVRVPNPTRRSERSACRHRSAVFSTSRRSV